MVTTCTQCELDNPHHPSTCHPPFTSPCAARCFHLSPGRLTETAKREIDGWWIFVFSPGFSFFLISGSGFTWCQSSGWVSGLAPYMASFSALPLSDRSGEKNPTVWKLGGQLNWSKSVCRRKYKEDDTWLCLGGSMAGLACLHVKQH